MRNLSLYSAPEAELIHVWVERNFLGASDTPTSRTGESFDDQTGLDNDDDWI